MEVFNPFADEAPPDFIDEFEEEIPEPLDFPPSPPKSPPRTAKESQNPSDFDDFDLDDLSEKENIQPELSQAPPEKRPRTNENLFDRPSQPVTESKGVSCTLPTLVEIKEVNFETKLKEEESRNQDLLKKIRENRARSQRFLPSESQKSRLTMSKTICVRPSYSDYVKIQPVSYPTQFYLRVRDPNLPEISKPVEAPSKEDVYPDFKKLKISALKALRSRSTAPKNRPVSKPTTQDTTLLVSKFAPKHFTSLLSDTAVNRLVLKYLQLWDHCVFRKPLPKKPEQASPPANAFGKPTYVPYNPLLDEYNFDSLGRPKHKVILLAGPAGLGKTTLAHVAAKHLGYNVAEINSSDDRSASALRELVKKYLSSTDVRNGMSEKSGEKIEARPTLLVLDEIDGASSAAVDVIVKLVTQPIKTKKNSDKKSKRRLPVLKGCG